MTNQQLKRKEFFEDQAHVWDEICKHDELKIDAIFNILDLKQGDRVLDVGTGTGILIPHIQKRVSTHGKITAVDYSKNMIMKAQEKYPPDQFSRITFIVTDILDLQCGHAFDAIICYSCFPHIEDKFSFFKKARELLRAGGRLLIAHSESREEINKLHSKKDEAVQDDYLPSAEDIITYACNSGLSLQAKVDDENLFCLLFKQ